MHGGAWGAQGAWGALGMWGAWGTWVHGVRGVHGVVGVPGLAPTGTLLLACPKTCGAVSAGCRRGAAQAPLLFDLPTHSPKARTESARLSRPVAPSSAVPPRQPWAGRRRCFPWLRAMGAPAPSVPATPCLGGATSPAWQRSRSPGVLGHLLSPALGGGRRCHLHPVPCLWPDAFVSVKKKQQTGKAPSARARDGVSPWHGHPWGPLARCRKGGSSRVKGSVPPGTGAPVGPRTCPGCARAAGDR